MPTIPHVIRIRRRREGKFLTGPARSLRAAGLCSSVLLSLIISFVTTGLALAYAGLTAELPSLETLPRLLEPQDSLMYQPTRFYDRSGEHEILVLEIPGAADREYLPLGREGQGGLSPALVQATIALADPNFWRHPGFTSLDQEPSLAQRLVADFLLWGEPPGLRRDLRERLLAAQLSARFGREKILEWYLNSADYGNHATGADAAARAYLGKPASQLNLAEATLLAAVSEAPALNPWDAPQAARERQQQVLEELSRSGSIDAGQLQEASREEVAFQPRERRTHPAPAFTSLVLEQVSGAIDPDRLSRGGFKVITSLDFDLQRQATCGAAEQIARMSGQTVQTGQAEDGFSCLAARLLPTEPTAGPRAGKILANLILLDPGTGQVLAMVGEDQPGLNPGRPAGHPPGTLLTPFIYLTAFTRGWSPASLAWDLPSSLPAEFTGLRNPDGNFHGPQRLRMALANDYLVPAAHLLADIGAGQVWRMAQQLGLPDPESSIQVGERGFESWRQAFEETEITLLEVSQAFGVFANQGVLVGQQPGGTPDAGVQPLQPITILQISDTTGRVWSDCAEQQIRCPVQSRPVISAQLAYLLTHVLSDEPARWPSLGHPNPLEIGRPAGAKIGRVSNGQQAWTVGFTPHLVAGVWLGTDEAGERISEKAAAGLWHAVLQYASRELPPDGWNAPPGISRVTVCDPSGMLPTERCPVVVDEVFMNGTEPTHTDGMFRAYRVNRETGMLATVFTPAGLVEERIYMLLPPEAGEWAEATGHPIPPQAYDPISPIQPGGENARILSPQLFSTVRGQVSIHGRASIEAFEYYRLQVGRGMNPITWLQIGENVERQVLDRELGVWDTSGLNGLYTVQLLVVAEEQKVEIATVQVTVDNQPPEVSIRFPIDGQSFRPPIEEPIILQAEASDELALASVVFILDGKELASLTSPPFAYPWPGRTGSHRLLVRARDQAGNTAEAMIEFVVEENQ